MTTISIEEVRRIQKRIDEINRIPFDDIEWVVDNKVVQFEPAVLSEWKYTGLSNMCFIEYATTIND